jgi:hypothetical protein
MCGFPRQVDSHVLCPADHFEIAEIVVQQVAVKVVDDLVGVEYATKHLLDRKPCSSNRSSIH